LFIVPDMQGTAGLLLDVLDGAKGCPGCGREQRGLWCEFPATGALHVRGGRLAVRMVAGGAPGTGWRGFW
jgi:hypothetical protein